MKTNRRRAHSPLAIAIMSGGFVIGWSGLPVAGESPGGISAPCSFLVANSLYLAIGLACLAVLITASVLYAIWGDAFPGERQSRMRSGANTSTRENHALPNGTRATTRGTGKREKSVKQARDTLRRIASNSEKQANSCRRIMGFAQSITELTGDTKRVAGQVVHTMELISSATGRMHRITGTIQGYAAQSRVVSIGEMSKMAALGSIPRDETEIKERRLINATNRELADNIIRDSGEAHSIAGSSYEQTLTGLDMVWSLQQKIVAINEISRSASMFLEGLNTGNGFEGELRNIEELFSTVSHVADVEPREARGNSSLYGEKS